VQGFGEWWDRFGRYMVIYAVLGIGSAVFLVPFYLMLRNAFMTQDQIVAFNWSWFAFPPNFQSFANLFNDPDVPMVSGLLHSLIIAICSVIGQLFFAALAGYGLARIPSRWSKPVFFFVLLTLMIPDAVTFVPGFVFVSYLGWVNTPQGMIVPTLFSGFATFWFRQIFLNFPKELEDAACLDGLSPWGTFWHIVLPNARNALVTQGTLIFVWSWNSFLWPLVIGQDTSSWTVQLVLSSFVTDQTIHLPEIFAGATVSILPLLILFLFLQRYIVQGVTRTSFNK
jgi:multiple sugar transport system permease protein